MKNENDTWKTSLIYVYIQKLIIVQLIIVQKNNKSKIV